MNAGLALSLWLLRLPTWIRLGLLGGVLIGSLGLYKLAFPTPSLEGVLILPIVLSAWLFGWRAGLCCFAGLIVILVASYRLAFGGTLWSSSWFFFPLIGMLSGLVICLVVGTLRYLTAMLLESQQTRENAERLYQHECTLNMQREQALQNLRHEVRTPITQIMGFLELLELTGNHSDVATRSRFLALAQSGCEELLSLTETALETAQSSATPSPHLRRVALRHEVQYVLAHFEPCLLQERQIELGIPGDLHVYADKYFIRQVMRNLLTNACKYTPIQTPIRMSAASIHAAERVDGRGDMICVHFCDQGPGIPPELQSQLFQRFVRLPTAATKNQPGRGLGLAICKQLIESMGGSIWVESTGIDGEGSCFVFTLPDANTTHDTDDSGQREEERFDEAEASLEEQHPEGAASTLRRTG